MGPRDSSSTCRQGTDRSATWPLLQAIHSDDPVRIARYGRWRESGGSGHAHAGDGATACSNLLDTTPARAKHQACVQRASDCHKL